MKAPTDTDAAELAFKALLTFFKPAEPAPALPLDDSSLYKELASIDERVERMAVHLARLDAQNVVLLKAVEAARADAASRFETLMAVVDKLLAVANAAVAQSAKLPALPEKTPVAAATAAVVKVTPRVMIVGLIASQAQMIEGEYKQCLNLRFCLADDAKGRGFANNCANVDIVITMTKFINHSIEETIKSAGSDARLVRVTGGMTDLREKLTDIYCHPQNYLKGSKP